MLAAATKSCSELKIFVLVEDERRHEKPLPLQHELIFVLRRQRHVNNVGGAVWS